jgi:hypothetical protein
VTAKLLQERRRSRSASVTTPRTVSHIRGPPGLGIYPTGEFGGSVHGYSVGSMSDCSAEGNHPPRKGSRPPIIDSLDAATSIIDYLLLPHHSKLAP